MKRNWTAASDDAAVETLTESPEPVKKRHRGKCRISSCHSAISLQGFCWDHLPDDVKAKCEFAGCDSVAIWMGFCEKHAAKTKTEQKSHPLKQENRGKCKTAGCNTAMRVQGLCVKHLPHHIKEEKKVTTKCNFNGCPSRQKKGGFCIKHRSEIKTQTLCKVFGCQEPLYQTGTCYGHREKIVWGIKVRPKCKIDGCDTQMLGGNEGLCYKHTPQEKKPKCQVSGCKTPAWKRRCCRKHLPRENRKNCTTMGCRNLARTAGGYCARHDPKSKCKIVNCQTPKQTHGLCFKHLPTELKQYCSVEGCTHHPYRGGKCLRHGGGFRCQGCQLFGSTRATYTFCSYCQPGKRSKKESLVVELLQKEIKTTITSNDRAIGGNLCSKRRPDILYDLPGWAIVVEVDEDSHETYPRSCEVARMEEITATLDKPTVFLRFNPDTHKVNGITTRVSMEERYRKLVERVKFHLENEPVCDPPTTVEYLFYDDTVLQDSLSSIAGITSGTFALSASSATNSSSSPSSAETSAQNDFTVQLIEALQQSSNNKELQSALRIAVRTAVFS